MILSDFPLPIYWGAFFISLSLTGLLVFTRRFHLAFTARSYDNTAIQASHLRPTPRIGGVGILVALAAAFLAVDGVYAVPSLTLFIITIIPVFAVGLLEDVGVPMRPRFRLAAAAVSSALMIGLLGRYLPRLDLPILDAAFGFAPFAALFTVFAATGVCHAINLIDGLNGLSGLVSVVIAIALAAIAGSAGDTAMAALVLCLVPAVVGFLVFNFPRGTIFLGDAGAYSIGHVLAWLAIIILWRNSDVSPWAVLSVFFWPVCDTLFAMYRRKRSGKPTDQPDRLHYHQLVMRIIEVAFLGRGRRQLTNPLATIVIMPLAIAPALAGVFAWDNPLLAGLFVFGFIVLFVGSYGLGMRSVRAGSRLRRRRIRQIAAPAGE